MIERPPKVKMGRTLTRSVSDAFSRPKAVRAPVKGVGVSPAGHSRGHVPNKTLPQHTPAHHSAHHRLVAHAHDGWDGLHRCHGTHVGRGHAGGRGVSELPAHPLRGGIVRVVGVGAWVKRVEVSTAGGVHT